MHSAARLQRVINIRTIFGLPGVNRPLTNDAIDEIRTRVTLVNGSIEVVERAVTLYREGLEGNNQLNPTRGNPVVTQPIYANNKQDEVNLGAINDQKPEPIKIDLAAVMNALNLNELSDDDNSPSDDWD